jgi:heme exporter protein A
MPPPTSAAATLAADDLACRRGGRLVFQALSFRLEPGDALLLRGPNGSGKSSLIRLLAGFLRPEAGRVAFREEDVRADLPAHRARVHLVAHADAVKPLLSVSENLRAGAGLLDGPADLERALAAFDLAPLASTLGRFLSSGQRRRAALARLLATPRPVWLLDEPGVGLDRASRARLEAAIADHRAAGGLCVVATHGDVAVPDPLVLDFGG